MMYCSAAQKKYIFHDNDMELIMENIYSSLSAFFSQTTGVLEGKHGATKRPGLKERSSDLSSSWHEQAANSWPGTMHKKRVSTALWLRSHGTLINACRRGGVHDKRGAPQAGDELQHKPHVQRSTGGDMPPAEGHHPWRRVLDEKHGRGGRGHTCEDRPSLYDRSKAAQTKRPETFQVSATTIVKKLRYGGALKLPLRCFNSALFVSQNTSSGACVGNARKHTQHDTYIPTSQPARRKYRRDRPNALC